METFSDGSRYIGQGLYSERAYGRGKYGSKKKEQSHAWRKGLAATGGIAGFAGGYASGAEAAQDAIDRNLMRKFNAGKLSTTDTLLRPDTQRSIKRAVGSGKGVAVGLLGLGAGAALGHLIDKSRE